MDPFWFYSFDEQVYRTSFTFLLWLFFASLCVHVAVFTFVSYMHMLIYVYNQRLRPSGENEVWLGSTDKHKEGQWKWLDGRPVDKGEWHSGQPDDAERREDCLDLRLNWHPPFNDYRCNVAQRFMCQFKG